MTEPVISDAVVEAAIDAFYIALRRQSGKTRFASERSMMRAAIRAAILADRAETVEKCARVCELAGMAEQHDYGLVRGTQNYFRAARAIRALSPAAPANQAKKATN